MPEKKKFSLMEKLKNTKVKRAAVLTTVLLLVAVAVIISVTVASNRSKKKNEPADTKDNTVTQDNTPSTKAPTTNPPATEAPNTEKPTTNVNSKLPTFILPVSGALSAKHDPKLQVYSPTMKDDRVHLGVDIVTEKDAPVYAAADGTVSRIWQDTRMGYCLAIKHSGGAYTIYKNLAKTLPEGISEGAKVRSGQLIASVGESAMVEVAEEPHLHFEMTVGDLAVDPLKYFSEKALESLKIDASHGE